MRQPGILATVLFIGAAAISAFLVRTAAAVRLEVGLLAKLALLRGADAETFLRQEQIPAWCVR